MHTRRLLIPVSLAALALAAAVPAAAQGSLPAPNVLYPANVYYPSGGYGDFSSTVLGEPYVQGIDVNVNWSSVETSNDPPNSPIYDWTGLDDEANAAYDLGKHIVLVVRAANETGGATLTNGLCTADNGQIIPSWEISRLQNYQGMDGSNGIYCDSDLETMIPDWFSSTFQTDFLTFIYALGQHVSQQPYYSYISYVRIGVGLGGEAFPVMPDGVPNNCTEGPGCQLNASTDLANMTKDWVPSTQTFPQAWENFQETMLAAYVADFPSVAGTGGAVIPAPPIIYPIDAQQTIQGHENPVDYEVADWATAKYNIGIGQEALTPEGITNNYADWDNILPMVFQNNPDVYVQFQTNGVTTNATDEDNIISAAEGYGAKSVEWYESTFTQYGPPSSSDMTNYQTWVNNNCDPACPAP